jgi:hypothetical protein
MEINIKGIDKQVLTDNTSGAINIRLVTENGKG